MHVNEKICLFNCAINALTAAAVNTETVQGKEKWTGLYRLDMFMCAIHLVVTGGG